MNDLIRDVEESFRKEEFAKIGMACRARHELFRNLAGNTTSDGETQLITTCSALQDESYFILRTYCLYFQSSALESCDNQIFRDLSLFHLNQSSKELIQHCKAPCKDSLILL